MPRGAEGECPICVRLHGHRGHHRQGGRSVSESTDNRGSERALPAQQRLVALLIASAMTFVGCGKIPIIQDAFVGCYAHEEDGDATVRITKESGGYVLAIRDGGDWETVLESMSPAEPADLRDDWGEDAEMVEKALVLEGAAFVRLRRDAVLDGEQVPSRYFLAAFLIGGPMYETECLR